MIIQNGFIEFITVTGGGLDSTTGHPMAATKEYGMPIPCQFVPVSLNMLAMSNSEPVTKLSWSIYIESHHRHLPLGERIRLTDLCGNEIGEYSVIKTVPLDAVCEYVLTV